MEEGKTEKQAEAALNLLNLRKSVNENDDEKKRSKDEIEKPVRTQSSVEGQFEDAPEPPSMPPPVTGHAPFPSHGPGARKPPPNPQPPYSFGFYPPPMSGPFPPHPPFAPDYRREPISTNSHSQQPPYPPPYPYPPPIYPGQPLPIAPRPKDPPPARKRPPLPQLPNPKKQTKKASRKRKLPLSNKASKKKDATNTKKSRPVTYGTMISKKFESSHIIKPKETYVLEHPSDMIIPQSGLNPRPRLPSVPYVLSDLESKHCPITDAEIAETDILLGRGGLTNHHAGNIWFRDLISKYRLAYCTAAKGDKSQLAQNLANYVRLNRGRFLQKVDDYWYEVGDPRAQSKCGQALREGTASMVRETLKASSTKLAKDGESDKKKAAKLKKDGESDKKNKKTKEKESSGNKGRKSGKGSETNDKKCEKQRTSKLASDEESKSKDRKTDAESSGSEGSHGEKRNKDGQSNGEESDKLCESKSTPPGDKLVNCSNKLHNEESRNSESDATSGADDSKPSGKAHESTGDSRHVNSRESDDRSVRSKGESGSKLSASKGDDDDILSRGDQSELQSDRKRVQSKGLELRSSESDERDPAEKSKSEDEDRKSIEAKNEIDLNKD